MIVFAGPGWWWSCDRGELSDGWQLDKTKLRRKFSAAFPSTNAITELFAKLNCTAGHQLHYITDIYQISAYVK